MYWTVHKHGAPRRVNHAAATIGTNIYMFGGCNSGVAYNYKFKPIDIHVIDTVKLKCLKLKLKDQDTGCVPFQRYGHTVVALGSNIYLWGGRNDRKSCNTLYCFNTNTLKWSKPHVKGNKPVGRDGHSACIIKNCMYIFGGFQKRRAFYASKLHMFNFDLMMWSNVSTIGVPPSYRDYHTATAIGNKMYIFGGRGDWHAPRQSHSDKYCPLMFYLDTSTGIWTCEKPRGDPPIPRRSHSAFVYNGFIYIFGGYNNNKRLHFNDIYKYDPVSCTWTKILPIGTPPSSRRRHICQVVNDKIFISGGAGPIVSDLPSHRRSFRSFDVAFPLKLKDNDDLHVLDLNPSLKDMCMVNVWKSLKEMNVDHIDNLCIPLSLKRELGAFDSIEAPVNYGKRMKSY